MNFDEIIASIAFSIGFLMMYRDLEKSENVDVKMKKNVMLSIFVSCLWFTYQYRKFGTNISTVYTGVGLILQIYILNRILLEETKINKE